MPRHLTLLLLAGGLLAAGCRTFEERAGLFPRFRDAIDPDANHRQPDYRFGDRYARPPAVAGDPCLPCAGGVGYPVGGLTGGVPGYGGYAAPVVYPGQPQLGTPIYPNGEGTPYRPRRDDELPLPGEYSRPGAAETGRPTAPKPPGNLPTGK